MNLLFTYRQCALIKAPKIHTDLLWDITILFAGLGILYFVSIFYFRNRFKVKAKRVAAKKKELSPMISEFLFYDENASKEEKSNYVHLKIEIRELLKDKFHKQVLAETLLDIEKDVSGTTHQKLCELYYDLGLHLEAFKKLKSLRWEVVAAGILELTRMKVEESYAFITKFINDRRGVVRKQAEIATLTLKHEGINYFLDTNRYKISEWQQLKLLDVLRKFEDFNPPKFKAWLTSKNPHVVLFALRLIKYYNQNDANSSLTALIKHKNNAIKSEALQCIKAFNVTEAIPVLKTMYWKCNTEIKLQLMDIVGGMGTKTDIAFLKSIEERETNFVLKSKALSAINNIAPQSILPTEGLDKKLQEEETKSTHAIPVSKAEIKVEKTAETTPNKIPDIQLDIAKLLESEQENEGLWDACIKDQLDEIIWDHKIAIGQKKDESMVMELNFLPLVKEEFDVDKTVIPEDDKAPMEEIDFTSMAFLPLVVEDKLFEEEQAIPKGVDILNITVISEEVKPFKASIDLAAIYAILEESITADAIHEIDGIEEEPEITIAFDASQCGILDMEVVEEVLVTSKPALEINNLEVISETVLPTDLETPIEDLNTPHSNHIEDLKLEDPSILSKEDELDTTTPSLLQNVHYNLPESVFASLYFDKDKSSRRLLLNTIIEVGDKREIPLLKEIVDNEESDALREDALKTLNEMSDIEYRICDGVLVTPDALSCQSIFKQLFETGDMDSKLLLIDEMAVLGDTKELKFLEELEYHKSNEIQEKALWALKHIKERLSLTDADITEISNTTKSADFTEKIVETLAENQERVPLEYCFLLEELEIDEAKPEMFDLNFELLNKNESVLDDPKIDTAAPDMEDTNNQSLFWGLKNRFTKKKQEPNG